MDKKELEQSVKEIVSLQFNVEIEKIEKEADFINDFNVDSLDTVEMIMHMEDKFCFSMTDEDAEKIINVGMLIDYVRNRLENKSGE
jgi:acyl carrier protein